MRRWRRSAAPVAAALAAAAAPAQASDHDAQVWTSLTATVPVAERVDATMEIHPRFTDEVTRLGQLLLRPSVTLKLPRGASASLGYVYADTRFRGTPRNREHRAWQQVAYTFVDRPALRLTGRTRLEQRFRVGPGDDTGWRLRQQLRLQLPVAGRTAALVWNETFVQLNDTDWRARAGVDQVRTFAGVAQPLRPGLALEAGYLNQTIFRIGPDRVNHILLTGLVARF